MEVIYWQCPMCGWTRPEKYGIKQRNAGAKRDVRFDKIDVEEVKVWQLRELHGAGRGSQEAKIELIDYKTLDILPDEQKQQIKNQCEKILQKIKE